MTVAEFRGSFKSQIDRLRRDIKSGEYAHANGRGVAILKKPGVQPIPKNVRPITVFNVRDRVIQRAISNLIWPYLRTHVFSDVSFGGIRSYSSVSGRKSSAHPLKNVRAAAHKIMALRRENYSFTFETDIQRFFPSIEKGRLLTELTKILPDDSLNTILQAVMETEVSNSLQLAAVGLAECWDPKVGVPQGGVLSPLLANFYLAPFDRSMVDHGFQLVRYVDDLVVLTQTLDEARRAYDICREKLNEMGLAIHELGDKNEKGLVKTRILTRFQPFDFLGLCFNKTTLVPSTSKVADLKNRIREITNTRHGGRTLIETIGRLNALLHGWMSAYRCCDIPREMLTDIDHHARSGLASWMIQYGILKSLNALTPSMQIRLGLWSVKLATIEPLSASFGAPSRRESLSKHRPRGAARAAN